MATRFPYEEVVAGSNPVGTTITFSKGRRFIMTTQQVNVNGVTLREALKRWEMRREAVAKQFDGSFFKRPAEVEKARKSGGLVGPEAVATEFARCERAVATLQAAQARYNLDTTVSVAVGGETLRMSLAEAVKTVGGLGRIEAMWRKAANAVDDPYENQRIHYSETDRKIDWPERQLALHKVVERATEAANHTGAVRGAIAVGNTREMLMTLDPDLLK